MCLYAANLSLTVAKYFDFNTLLSQPINQPLHDQLDPAIPFTGRASQGGAIIATLSLDFVISINSLSGVLST